MLHPRRLLTVVVVVVAPAAVPAVPTASAVTFASSYTMARAIESCRDHRAAPCDPTFCRIAAPHPAALFAPSRRYSRSPRRQKRALFNINLARRDCLVASCHAQMPLVARKTGGGSKQESDSEDSEDLEDCTLNSSALDHYALSSSASLPGLN